MDPSGFGVVGFVCGTRHWSTSTTPLSSASATVIFIFDCISRPMNSV